MLLPHVTTSDSPAASDSSAVTPYNSSAILSDWPTFLREDGVHPSASVDGAGAAGGGTDTGAWGGGGGGPPGPGTPPGARREENHVGPCQRHQAGGQQARQDGNRSPDILLRHGRKGGDGDAAGGVHGGGRRERGHHEAGKEKDRAEDGASQTADGKGAHRSEFSRGRSGRQYKPMSPGRG